MTTPGQKIEGLSASGISVAAVQPTTLTVRRIEARMISGISLDKVLR